MKVIPEQKDTGTEVSSVAFKKKRDIFGRNTRDEKCLAMVMIVKYVIS